MIIVKSCTKNTPMNSIRYYPEFTIKRKEKKWFVNCNDIQGYNVNKFSQPAEHRIIASPVEIESSNHRSALK